MMCVHLLMWSESAAAGYWSTINSCISLIEACQHAIRDDLPAIMFDALLEQHELPLKRNAGGNVSWPLLFGPVAPYSMRMFQHFSKEVVRNDEALISRNGWQLHWDPTKKIWIMTEPPPRQDFVYTHQGKLRHG